VAELKKDYDVIVCGGGPAGIGAALAASRKGAATLLIEYQFGLGGIASGAFIHNFMDTPHGPIFKELLEELIKINAAEQNYDPEIHYKTGRFRFHAGTFQALALKKLRESGCDILLGTLAESAFTENGTVKGVYAANKGGRFLIKAKTVIDSSADGDIAASSGAEFMKGDPDDGRIQHVNFKFHTENIDHEAFQKSNITNNDLAKLFRNAVKNGVIHPPKGAFNPGPEAFPFSERDGRFALAKWEIEKVDPSDPVQLSDTIVECQIAAFEMLEFCRKSLPGYENTRIGRFPSILGTRESRRIKGKYVLTGDDALHGRKFDDGVVRAAFFLDFHDSPPGKTIPYSVEYKKSHSPPKGDYYEIPYRALLPEKTKGLLTAGRCISATREGLASMRVMPTCMYTGTAAGIASAIAAQKNILPDEIDGREIKTEIEAMLENQNEY
jgi:hypothetical protein